jgi:valyl-tRNA synthetase
MIFSGMEFMKKKPFDDVIIHATILAKNGQRMSKSLGTGVDPLDLVNKYGADATRFGVIYQAMGQQDIHFSEEDIVMAKRFANKIWNASRFVLIQLGDHKTKPLSYKQITNSAFQSKLTPADKKIIKKLHQTIKDVDKDLDNFKFGQAAHKVYDYFWHDLCDTYIEAAKQQEGEKTKKVLSYVLINSLKLLHPFLPFVTESVYQKLPFKQKQMLITENWPK